MKTIQPVYYDKFTCIAGRCPYTCCQEWDISVDNETTRNWRSLKVPEKGKDEPELLSSFVKYGKNECTLKFASNKKCHLLNEKGLCKVVLSYGEEKIPETCHLFPREETFFTGRTEKALSPGCPAVLDLLWSEDAYGLIENSADASSELPSETAAFRIRDWFCQLFKERRESTILMLKFIFCVLRDIREVIGKNEEVFTGEFVENYIVSTNCDEVFAALKAMEADKGESFIENNELFLDLTSRYLKEKKYSSFLEPAAAFAENMSKNDYPNLNSVLGKYKEINSKSEKYLRQLIWEEIGSSLIDECNPESMQVKLEWIILEYAVLKQALFLKAMLNNEANDLSYEEIREVTSIMCRVTGFTEKDIREFMKAEFESIIWPLDYMLLVLN